MKRSFFKRNPNAKPMKRTRLHVKGTSTTTELKDEIQALVRKIGLLRDGGCVLRHFPEAGECGGYRKDGELILQAEHLATRANSSTFGDMRNIVILCRNHHIFFKPQFGKLYWELIRRHIGEFRWVWLKRVEEDRTPHKVDLKLEILALKSELRKYESNS